MAKALKYIGTVLAFLIVCGLCLYAVNSMYDARVKDSYYGEIGNLYASTAKNQGIILQQISANSGDNLLIFGSSELGSVLQPFHPAYFFAGKKDGFQVNLIGRGYSQSLIHAINIGALGEDLKGGKVVLIISPQWFSEGGLEPANFNMNFSEQQFYSFMQNTSIDKSLKLKVAGRVKELAGQDSLFENTLLYSELYTRDNILSNTALALSAPYYGLNYYLFSIKDKINAQKTLNDSRESVMIPKDSSILNWEKEKEDAVLAGKSQANNNEFLIENKYYDTNIKNKVDSLKGSMKLSSYSSSPEYGDFRLLLDICKSEGIKPLIVSVPVNGRWYDYCGFDKSKRQEYYNNIKQIVASYDFDIADFSGYEYEDYFLKDTMHLGWKGWVYVDEAIDRYYHKDQR